MSHTTLQVLEADLDDVAKLVAEEMTQAGQDKELLQRLGALPLAVPFPVKQKVGKSWDGLTSL